jgi:hypothetical protein
MVGTLNGVGEVAGRLLAQPRAAVAADVEERPHGLVSTPRDDE